ncbi:FAD-dependent oxidoreductase [Euhalothece natronophila Z-M001]|uniref:FAD-dependent oxidoreductase n=1 Tax=Euhalothece natronophila Z-M001 TaxID=522448 RepID=A0A5B8NLT3_9CHRO|nr:NAD(P)/FAD-dependent oxidoreductase [Euhalothece natronophila]QDZ39897.1 FAD-dependent oxidoreductase [Euhalothece natronophila Z-M001]
MSLDVIIVGSGIGGLTAGSLLARYGYKVLICESHSIPGGAAHSFTRKGFTFDSGPSFYAGIGSQQESLNPLQQVLRVLGETLETVPYDPLGEFHFPEGTFAAYQNNEQYCQEISKITPEGGKEYQKFLREMLGLYDTLKEIPTIELRGDRKVVQTLIPKYLPALLKSLPKLPLMGSSVGKIRDKTVSDPWVKRLIDLECFLLSGLKAEGTIAPEIAFMLGERSCVGVEYPIGGSGAIVEALIRGLKRWGGEIKLNAHVENILVTSGKVEGVKLQNGETIKAPIVISNATIWDTYNSLLNPQDLPTSYRQSSLETPALNSFMHLHLGIRAEGLETINGHHVVVHDSNQDIATPGNTCMISIPTVWDSSLAPPQHHLIHAYTLEPYQGWQRDHNYQHNKRTQAETLYQAIEKIIPDLRSRITLELIGSPLTHAHYLRRYQGTYGPAIPAEEGLFPRHKTPISGLYRVGDSTLPGIGVPAVAASGILCANSLVSPQQQQWGITRL